MLENNNLKICRKLVLRDFKFHKTRNGLLVAAIALVVALFSFVFLLGSAVESAFLTNYEWFYGSTCHILYYGLTEYQADKLAEHADVKSGVRLKTLGLLTDAPLEYRSVKLAVADSDYAQTVLSVPENGRMPLSDDEIALDEFTMSSLGIPYKLGAPVTIRWTPNNGGKEQTTTFTLCGFWSSFTNHTEACAWITEEKAHSLMADYDAQDAQNITLGITLHQPKDLEVQAEKMIDELGLDELSFTTNLAYNEARLDMANDEAMPYYFVNIFVVLCGFFMIYSIIRISAEQDVRFYGQLKTLGMTPKQIQRILYEQAGILCIISLPIGWILGFLLYYSITPKIVVGMDVNTALYFLSYWPFALSAALTLITVLFAYFMPAHFAGKISPADAVRFTDKKTDTGKRGSRGRQRTTLFRMAAASLFRNKGRTIMSAVSLFLAMVLLCGTWIDYISYDENIFLSAMAKYDYSIVDGSAATYYQRYNPESRTITQEMINEIKKQPGIRQMGLLKTTEVNMTADKSLYDTVCGYYNSIGYEDIPRRDEMSAYPDWCTGYERFEATAEYIGIVVGLDGLALDTVMNESPPNDGWFDKEKFAGGNYVIAAGAASADGISTIPAGETITIGGREFTVMASIPYDSMVISGNNSRTAEFSLLYYLPLSAFDELYSDSGIRQLMVNIDYNYQKDFETFLDKYEQGISIIMRSYYQQTFEAGRLTATLVNFIVALILLLIGLMNFVNALAVKTIVRHKEFAVYESLGMTKQQLRKMLVLEGLLHTSLVLAFLIPAVFFLTWFGMPIIFTVKNSWTITYQYSLNPLFIMIPALLLLSILTPLGCLWFITRNSVTERLRIVE